MTEFRDSYLSRAKKAAPRAPLLPRPGTMLAAIAALEARVTLPELRRCGHC